MSARALPAIVLLAAGMNAACMVTGLESYRKSLTVTARSIEAPPTVSNSFVAHMTIENHGSWAVEFCYDDVTARVAKPEPASAAQQGVIIGHAPCSRRLVLRRGTTINWEETFPRDLFPASESCFTMTVQISNPVGCDGPQGCSTAVMEAANPVCLPAPHEGPQEDR